MKVNESMAILQKIYECINGECPVNCSCDDCPYDVSDDDGNEAIKTVLIYLADEHRNGEADVPDKNVGKCSEIPNSSDTISRQAAIDALSEAGLINYTATGDGNGMIQAVNVIKGLPPAQPEHSEGLYVDGYNDGYRDGMKDTQPEPQWIPVSERLPKKWGRYQVTRYDYVTNTEFIDILWYEENLWWNRRSTGDYAVTAWMPLPKPYRKEKKK